MGSDPRIELAYRMAIDAIAEQKTALDELRQRVGVVLSGAAVATGFLAGQALDTTHGIPESAWVAIASALALVIVATAVLWPASWAGFDPNPSTVLQDVDDQPTREIDSYYRGVAEALGRNVLANRSHLLRRYQLFSGCLVFLVVDFAGWIWTLAHN